MKNQKKIILLLIFFFLNFYFNFSQIKCFGTNSYGELGDDATYTSTEAPVNVVNEYYKDQGILELTSGTNFNCLLNGLNNLYCWGRYELKIKIKQKN